MSEAQPIDMKKYDPWALIVGGSEGIGAAAIDKGPLLLLGGEASLRIAMARSQLVDRDHVIHMAGTPRHEAMAQAAIGSA